MSDPKFLLPLLFYYSFFLFFIGCKEENINNPQTNSFEQRASGIYNLSDEYIIVLKNFIGPVFINGEITTNPSVRWFIYKKVEAESEEKANEIFPLIQPAFSKSHDTLFINLDSPIRLNLDAGIELDLPASMICIIENVKGNAQIFYMDSIVFVRNAMNVELKNHIGSSDISITAGNIFAESALPTGGFCRLRTVTGNIFISIPAHTSAEVYARSINGTFSYSGLTFTNIQQGSGGFNGTLGSGEGEIRAEVNTGNIQINAIQN